MTKRERIGVVVLVSLFVVFTIILVFTVRTLGNPRPVEESFFVQQRIRNLNR